MSVVTDLLHQNRVRAKIARRMTGKTPMQTFLDAMPIIDRFAGSSVRDCAPDAGQ
jgi:hypothetical protein